MNKKLLLFDLDDTLLTSEKSITKYSIEAIKSCKEKGMIIGYITGRARASKMNDKIFSQTNIICPVILSHITTALKYVLEIHQMYQ